jgi:hypothetical protein
VGHSVAFGWNAQAVTHGWASKLAKMLHVPRYRNWAWPAALVAYDDGGSKGGYATVLQRPQPVPLSLANLYVPTTQVAVVQFGINDLAQFGSQAPGVFVEGYRTVLSRLRACAGRVFVHSAGRWTYGSTAGGGGAWTTSTFGTLSATDGAGFHQGGANTTDIATFTTDADHDAQCPVAVCVLAISGLTMEVMIDGVAQADWTVPGPGGSRVVGCVHRLMVPAGAHTIRLRRKSGTDPLYVDSAWIEARSDDCPVLMPLLTNKQPTYAGAYGSSPHGPNAGSDPLNAAAVDSWRATQRAVHAEFPNVLEVDPDTVLGAAAGAFGTDGLHYNEVGHAAVAWLIRNRLMASGLPTDRMVSRAVGAQEQAWVEVARGANAPGFGGTWVNYASGFPTVAFALNEAGEVELRGYAKSGVVGFAQAPIFTLPQGMRPLAQRTFAQDSNSAHGRVSVFPSGAVNLEAGSNVWVALDGIKLRAGQ